MWWTISPISSMWPTIASDRPVAGAGTRATVEPTVSVVDLGEAARLAEDGGRRLLVAGGPGAVRSL